MKPINIDKTPRSARAAMAPPPAGPARPLLRPTLSRSYPRGTHLGLHVHREAQLLFAARGVMQVSTPKGRWLTPPARALWLPAGIEHGVDVLADLEMRALLIDTRWLANHPQAHRLDREFVVAVRPLLREMVLAAFGDDMREDMHPRRIELLLELVLFELIEAEDGATFMPLPTDPRARRIAEWVLADPLREHELAALAERAGASARTISRLFPAETELTFKAWRQRARIMAGIEALSHGDASIKQVASRLGFASVAAFSHAFRQVTGITPSAMIMRIGNDRPVVLR